MKIKSVEIKKPVQTLSTYIKSRLVLALKEQVKVKK